MGKKAFEEAPLAPLGFGIVAYDHILWTLIVMFALFSLMLLPSIRFFQAGTGYASVNPKVQQYEKSSLGNLGYSSVQCANIPVSVGRLNMQCPFGTIGQVLDYGVNKNIDYVSNCASIDAVEECAPTNPNIPVFLDGAIGSSTFLVTFDAADLYVIPIPECTSDVASRVFVQYTCVQSQEDQSTKYQQMSFTVFINILIAFFFTITIRYLYQGGKITQLDWDMSTVTAGDYTVEFDITRDAYNDWKELVYNRAGGAFENHISPGLALKTFMAEQIEEILDRYLREHPEAYLDDEAAAKKKKKDKKKKKKKKKNDGSFTPTKVADIVFSFNNRDLILALRKRGACIAGNDFDGMRE